jgi:hypothetical protein
VLDSMESRFTAAAGDLSCRLMAALQGAKMVGADTRCASNGSSALFAFVKVSQPSDPDGAPSFLVSVRTHNGAGIEPIDTLQTLFDAVKSCTATGFSAPFPALDLRFFPNPARNFLKTEWGEAGNAICRYEIRDALGRSVMQMHDAANATLQIGTLAPGLYHLQILDEGQAATAVFVKE